MNIQVNSSRPIILHRSLGLLLAVIVLATWSLWEFSISTTSKLSSEISEDVTQQEEEMAKMIRLMVEVERPEHSESNQPSSYVQANEIVTKKMAVEESESGSMSRDAVSRKPEQAGETVSGVGRSPRIQGSFDVDVLDYVNAVRRLAGGRLVVWNQAAGEPMGEVVSGRFTPSTKFASFSNRARDITNDLPEGFRDSVLQQVRQVQSFGLFKFVLVIPEAAEAQFQQAISQALAMADLSWSDTNLVWLRYRLNNGHVVAQVESASSAGRLVSIQRTVKLW